VPHWLQNRIAGSLAAPQFGQLWLSAVPQPPQKRELAGFSVPQFVQIIASARLSVLRDGRDY
jgi:hypothetical protein